VASCACCTRPRDGICCRTGVYTAPLFGGGINSARHSKKKTTDPDVYLIIFRETNRPQIYFLEYFFSTFFGRFSVRGIQKHHKNVFAKSPCRKLFTKKSTKISMSVFLDFLFYRVFGFSQEWEFKNTTKNVLQKNRVERFLQKNRQTNP
jgi:hypothetical protein